MILLVVIADVDLNDSGADQCRRRQLEVLSGCQLFPTATAKSGGETHSRYDTTQKQDDRYVGFGDTPCLRVTNLVTFCLSVQMQTVSMERRLNQIQTQQVGPRPSRGGGI